MGGYLRGAAFAQSILDLLAETCQIVRGHRAALARLGNTGDRFLAIKGLGSSRTLLYHQLHLFDRREPLITCRTRATLPDHTAVIDYTAVQISIVVLHAYPATQWWTLQIVYILNITFM